MFGSSYDTNFGLPAFPFQGADPQGGYLGVNVSPEADPAAAGAQSLPGGPTSSPTGAAPAAPAPPAASPLAGGPLSPGGAAPLGGVPDTSQGQAPAAGIGSPFGKPTS